MGNRLIDWNYGERQLNQMLTHKMPSHVKVSILRYLAYLYQPRAVLKIPPFLNCRRCMPKFGNTQIAHTLINQALIGSSEQFSKCMIIKVNKISNCFYRINEGNGDTMIPPLKMHTHTNTSKLMLIRNVKRLQIILSFIWHVPKELALWKWNSFWHWMVWYRLGFVELSRLHTVFIVFQQFCHLNCIEELGICVSLRF